MPTAYISPYQRMLNGPTASRTGLVSTTINLLACPRVHKQQRTISLRHYLLGDAAKYEVAETASTVGGHHNQINAGICSGTDDLFRSVRPRHNPGHDFYASAAEVRLQGSHLIP